MKLRKCDPWMPADEFGRTLEGFGNNLLVVESERALAFQTAVLAGAMDKPYGLREVYVVDPDGYVWVADIARATD